MKWGSRYGPEFVNRLYASIKRHTKKATKVYCFTDDSKDINEHVICKPLPEVKLPNIISLTPWRKLSVWQFPLYNLKGDVLFLDLDLVITGNLDRFFDYKPGSYCVIENWTQLGQNIGNTSCFRFPIGKYSSVFKKFLRRKIPPPSTTMIKRYLTHCPKLFFRFSSDDIGLSIL